MLDESLGNDPIDTIRPPRWPDAVRNLASFLLEFDPFCRVQGEQAGGQKAAG